MNNPNKGVNEQIKQKLSQSSKSIVPVITNKKKENEENNKIKENNNNDNISIIICNFLEEEMKTPSNINKSKKRERIDSSDIEEDNHILEKKISNLNLQKHKRASSSSYLNKFQLIEEENNQDNNSKSSSGKSFKFFSIDLFTNSKRSKSKDNKVVNFVTIKTMSRRKTSTNVSVSHINSKHLSKQRSLFYKQDK